MEIFSKEGQQLTGTNPEISQLKHKERAELNKQNSKKHVGGLFHFQNLHADVTQAWVSKICPSFILSLFGL